MNKDSIGHGRRSSCSMVGTAVVIRGDGRLVLGRMGSLCELVNLMLAQFPLYGLNSFLNHMLPCLLKNYLQIWELTSQGFEVILVTSGAVGVGRHWKLINNRFSFQGKREEKEEEYGKMILAKG
ncbi:delta-1-pyrroline-5-carboxylate synthase-like [Solanum dulcamara]|uniref:delta-1-pyrroline-5-carboxylate synthase-like n=1 Tax=Solanum dulcamara TaxID=45834 RepID=UPI002485A932|nr:delta-1-pyrroline-5-carboxylate synthase-like [Solanum dulcamara]